MMKRNKSRATEEKESVASKETEMKEMHHAAVGMNTEDMADISSKLTYKLKLTRSREISKIIENGAI